MNDQLIDPAGADAGCAARGPSGEVRIALPSAAAITTLAEAREAIDDLDAALATLLEHRTAVAAVVQRLKPVGGFAGRDPERERRIVESMAARAPSLGPDRIAPIVNAIIEAGLDAAESGR